MLGVGAALGTSTYTDQFVSEKVDQWCGDLLLLSAIATTQPDMLHLQHLVMGYPGGSTSLEHYHTSVPYFNGWRTS